MKDEANLADLLEEADELVNRFAPREAAESWERNLEVVTTLLVVHRCWLEPGATVGQLVREMMPLARTCFEMGRQAAEGSGQSSVVSGQ